MRRRPVRPRWLSLITSPLRCLPDFLIIGAQKSATTSLFARLDRHPAVWMPSCKECHFFSRPWRPAVLYRAFFMLGWKRRRLERSLGRPVLLGEATPYYLFHPAAPARAARILPRARLIVLLRNPVERAYSHYRHCVRLGRETLSFEDALAAEPERTAGEAERLARFPFGSSAGHQHYSYAARGRYAEQLRRWLAHFDRAQIHVEIVEHMFADPAATLARVERFLELPPGPPHPFETHNQGIEMGSMTDEARTRLLAAFAEPNRELEALLEIELPWPRS